MLNQEKRTFNFDPSLIDEEQLFTELTAEEAAVIEGGNVLYLSSIKAVRTGGDSRGKDEPYLLLNGRRIWGWKSMSQGQTIGINQVFFEGSGTQNLQLWEYDPGPNNDDFMGSVRIDVSRLGSRTARFRAIVGGRMTAYDLKYIVAPKVG
ncbi:MAG: hypothetical protein QNJ63_23100 [Calothrix sp. MO_192.B10]|nr:hypothetical protein [Calothrix sp. MO_192.B10]